MTFFDSTTRRLALAAGAFLLAMGVAACTSDTGPADQEHAEAGQGVGHIHGVGVDPATGKVHVAGHFGLFTIEGKSLVRVGDRDADHMGFTVAGPKTFYASGHPAADDIAGGQPPHLGLIRSTDSGITWEQLALAGQADFHALQVAGDTVYGYDSQTGRVWHASDGGKGLQPAAELELVDLAAGSEAPGTVYATTPDGVKVSTDAGKSFGLVKGAPLLSFLDVIGKDLLVGVAPDGQIHSSPDSGKTWQAAGRLPRQAVAFTAVSAERLLAADEEGAVYQSENGGKDFVVLYRP